MGGLDHNPRQPASADVTQLIRTKEFNLSLRGYSVDEVDSWLEEAAVAATNRAGGLQLTTPRKPDFRTALRGYDITQVDAFVELVIRDLSSEPEMGTPQSDSERLAEEARTKVFKLSLRGHSVAEVDKWLEDAAVAATNRAGGLQSTPPAQPAFRTTLRGYDTSQVDAFTASIIRGLSP